MKRRSFLQSASIFGVGMGLGVQSSAQTYSAANPLPKWKGFNLLDFFNPDPEQSRITTTADHLKWIRDWGFNFVRIPIAYPYYLKIDRTKNILPEDVYHIDEAAVERIDSLVMMAHQQNIHTSLNLHRAPGYCINAGFHEPYNLWKDKVAQDAFYFHWAMWAKRFKNISPDKISFDLLNEPCMRDDMNDQHSSHTAVPGELYMSVAKAASAAIRKENSKFIVIADGNNVGNDPIPELIDLNIAQSCRGYNPGAISHYKAPWANKDPEHMPVPVWPGQIGEKNYQRSMLETYYKPWIDLTKKGVGVHCGECGCWNKTPHEVFLAWFGDVLDILSTAGIGFALWEFIGSFGVLDSGRTDIAYEDWQGHKLDRKLLELLRKY